MGGLDMLFESRIEREIAALKERAPLAMAISMPANSLLLAWMVIVGVLMWRRSAEESE